MYRRRLLGQLFPREASQRREEVGQAADAQEGQLACVNQTGKEQSERVDEEDDGKGHKQEVLKMVPERGSVTTCDAQGCSCVASCHSDAVKCRTVVVRIQISFIVVVIRQLQRKSVGLSPHCATKKSEKVSHAIIHTKQLKHSSENQETVRTHTQTPHTHTDHKQQREIPTLFFQKVSMENHHLIHNFHCHHCVIG